MLGWRCPRRSNVVGLRRRTSSSSSGRCAVGSGSTEQAAAQGGWASVFSQGGWATIRQGFVSAGMFQGAYLRDCP